MALTNSITWRVRGSGNNANGGGFDPTTSGALSTTITGAISAGATAMNVSSATGWPSATSFYCVLSTAAKEPVGGGSEVVLVSTTGGGAAWTITRAQLGTTALAFPAGAIVSNELSRCNTAPWSGATGASTASNVFTDGSANFNLTVVGNVLYLASGTGATVGGYLITGYNSPTSINLDRASGTYTNGAWKIGGAWADPAARAAIPIAGNTTYVRAGGSGSVASPDYTVGYPGYANGDGTNGPMHIIGESGRPWIKCTNPGFIYTGSAFYVEDLVLVSNTTGVPLLYGTGVIKNVTLDQNGKDQTILNWSGNVTDSEFLSSSANGGAAGTNYAIVQGAYGLIMNRCNVHDCWGGGLQTTAGFFTAVVNSLFANNKGTAIYLQNGSGQTPAAVQNCTIVGNGADGIYIANADTLSSSLIQDNIIKDHTGAGKYGIKTGSGTTASNDRMRGLTCRNWFHNNTADALNLTVGALYGDSTGVDPGFSSAANENYAITGAAKGWAARAFVNTKSGTTPPTSYQNPGAVMGNPAGGASMIIVGM